MSDHEEAPTADDVRYCYRLLLGREPDDEGLKHWLRILPTVTRQQLVHAFFDSVEFRERLVAPNTPVLAELESFALYVRPFDTLIGSNFRKGVPYEPHVAGPLSSTLRAGDTFLDVGGNLGYFSFLASKIVGPTGRVITFEPHYDNCALFRLSAFHNRCTNVTLHPYAVSDREQLLLLQNSLNSSNGATVVAHGPVQTDMLVQAVTLDSMLGDLDRLDVMKIDIEGSELAALRGGGAVLRRYRPVLFSEFFPALLRASGSEPEEYLEALRSLGYVLRVLDDLPGVPADGSPVSDATIMAIWGDCPDPDAAHLDLLATQG